MYYLSEKTRKIYEENLKELEARWRELNEEKRNAYKDSAGYTEKQYSVAHLAGEMQTVANQIAEIKKVLSEAIDVERQHGGADDVVDIGDKVTVLYIDKNEQRTFTLTSVYMQPGDVSMDSPVGKAVYLKKLGDTVEIVAPKGIINAKIIGLENAQDISDVSEPTV